MDKCVADINKILETVQERRSDNTHRQEVHHTLRGTAPTRRWALDKTKMDNQ